LKLYDPEVVRFFLLASHYRSPLNYSDESLEQAKGALTRLYTALKGVAPATAPSPDVQGRTSAAGGRPGAASDYERRFFEAMDDDFNSPLAVSVLFDLARDLNKAQADEPEQAAALGAVLRKLGGVLGILQREPEDFLKAGAPAGGSSDAEIERLIERRAAAKRAGDYAEADRIRDELKAQGVILEDGKGGTTWRRG
jgi:cysteinyl-tRNA synthetase